MDMRTIQSGIGDPEIPKLLDKILDDVLALKARLADSNRDSNSLGGIIIPPAFSLISPFTNDKRVNSLSGISTSRKSIRPAF